MNRTSDVEFYEAYQITSALAEFEHVLGAELGLMNIYLIAKVRGYSTTDLVLNGSVLFLSDLALKVPEAQLDISSATRCIAFELATAAGSSDIGGSRTYRILQAGDGDVLRRGEWILRNT